MVNFCSKCGAKQDDTDSKFCIECGASLDNKEDIKEKSLVENKTPAKVVTNTNKIGMNMIICPFCKKQIPINSTNCPFCNSVINSNNNHVGATILGYILGIVTFISTLIGLKALILSLPLMILTFIVIVYLFSTDNKTDSNHAIAMSIIFILSLIVVCINAAIVFDKIERLTHALSYYY